LDQWRQTSLGRKQGSIISISQYPPTFPVLDQWRRTSLGRWSTRWRRFAAGCWPISGAEHGWNNSRSSGKNNNIMRVISISYNK
jgi:hypothetical protein